MINAVHTLIYSTDPVATRRFFKKVLRWPYVTEGSTDEPEEWLIFRTGPSEIGVHPTRGPGGETWGPEGQHQIALMCDDLPSTMKELESRGAHFDGKPEEMGFGVGIDLPVAAAGKILLYEARHPVAFDL
ncbi:VOC family protein [uncultured Serinicoccus sp.]|uniref:VOC family protein n=1 Tax=uncultured Serinicoccus sp. TaxID=735514 RepID=UPI002610BCED|nr:VOC family protein [uncultured Serinicoccus sp.]